MSDQDFPPHGQPADCTCIPGEECPWPEGECPYDAVERASQGTRRHPLSQRFHELLAEAGDLHDLKQADYGLDSDPFANVRASQAWGMPAWVGAMVRATDKVRRLQTFSRKGELKNESVQDAFLDLAVYALIAYILWEEEEAAKSDDPAKDTFA